MHAQSCGTLVSIFVQLFFRKTSNTIDLNSTEVNYSFLQESVMIPLWLNLEVTHVVSAWSHWSEALYMHLAGGEAWEIESLFQKWV